MKKNATFNVTLSVIFSLFLTGRSAAQSPVHSEKKPVFSTQTQFLRNMSEKLVPGTTRWTRQLSVRPAGKRISKPAKRSANAGLFPSPVPMPTSDTLYVDQLAKGLNNGVSWANAFRELADALSFAKANSFTGQIWVAYGIYKPLYHPGTNVKSLSDRDNAFMLLPNVKIYGGFYGDETSVEERDLTNVNAVLGGDSYLSGTILSGDFNNDDVAGFKNRGENAYHVVLSIGNAGTAGLDGVTILGSGAPTAESTLLVGTTEINRSSGGGITLYNSSPRLTNLKIWKNLQKTGPAIYAVGSTFVMTNSLVSDNYAPGHSTVELVGSSPIITNVTIANNVAGNSGGGIAMVSNSSPQIRNTIIYGNSSVTNPDIQLEAGIPVYTNCIVKGSGGSTDWDVTFGINGGNNLDANPQFYDTTRQVYGLLPTSPAINTGDSTFFGTGGTPDLNTISTDIRGSARIMKDQIDIGAFESRYATVSSTLIPTAGRIYVKKGGNGEKNGSSWDDAAAEVADALLAARLNPLIVEIWVAGGTYHPLYDPEDLSEDNADRRFNAFVMVQNVKVYGGFAGNENALDQRDLSIKTNASILSGDYDGNDQFDISSLSEESIATAQENAFHLVYMVGEMGEAVMDGFNVEGAGLLTLMLFENSDSDDLEQKILLINESSIPFLIGGGVTTIGSSAHFSNLIVRKNFSLYGSGLISFGGDLLITNSLFHSNASFILGSGITGLFTSMNIIGTTVTNNLASTGAGVILQGGISTIANSICFGNLDFNGNALDVIALTEDDDDEQLLEIRSSLIGGSGGSADWSFEFATDGGGNLDEDPLFTNTSAGDFSLIACSNAVNAGTNAFYEENGVPDLSATTKDLAGNARIFLETVDMGAYEFNGDITAAKPLARDGNEFSYAFTASDAYTFSAQSGNCTLDILTLKPGTLTGNVTSRVWKDDAVNTFAGAPYLQRHYDIEPENNPENATGLITLYFSQEEFDAFNAEVGPSEFLPTGNPAGEDERKANLRIYQFHGTSSDGSGDPSTYLNGSSVIQPRVDDITWNDALQRWEVSFEVAGFSGFFAGTQSQSLPVRLVSFDGRLTDDDKVQLDWVVAEQENIHAYGVEYSANGKVFSEIGFKPAGDLSSTTYSYMDTLQHQGLYAYYRLNIIEMDGKKAYSKLVAVKLPDNRKVVVYPVPAKNQVWLQWKANNMTSAEITNTEGKVIKTVTRSAERQPIDISVLPAGIYFLRPQGSAAFKLIKE